MGHQSLPLFLHYKELQHIPFLLQAEVTLASLHHDFQGLKLRQYTQGFFVLTLLKNHIVNKYLFL